MQVVFSHPNRPDHKVTADFVRLDGGQIMVPSNDPADEGWKIISKYETFTGSWLFPEPGSPRHIRYPFVSITA